MDAVEHLKQTLEYYRQQRQKKLDDYRVADALVRQLERDLGETPSGETDQIIMSGPAGPFEPSQTAPKTNDVRPDEFYSMSQSEAAKTYLRKIKRAIPFDQLVEALRRGGAQLGGADPKKTLNVSLARNPLKEFVYPQDDYIGLREFYPNLPKVSGAREGGKDKRSKKKGKKKKKKGNAENYDQKQPSVLSKNTNPVRTKVHEIMSDGKARTSGEIVDAVQAELGHIKKILVFGSLRDKRFKKQEDGKYALSK